MKMFGRSYTPDPKYFPEIVIKDCEWLYFERNVFLLQQRVDFGTVSKYWVLIEKSICT